VTQSKLVKIYTPPQSDYWLRPVCDKNTLSSDDANILVRIINNNKSWVAQAEKQIWSVHDRS